MTDQQNLSMADLDQVRNILFGRQMKASEKRIDSFERTLAKEIQGLKNELSKRMDALEKAMTQQGTELTAAIDEEAGEREAALEVVNKQAADFKKSAEERFTRLTELNTRTSRELRQRIANDVKATKELLGGRIDELAVEVETETADLRELSVGKEDLSAFLGDIALKLVNKKQIRRS